MQPHAVGAQRPASENIVLTPAEQTVHEDELGDGPADPLDRLLFNAALVVEQGLVRRELRLDAGGPDLLHAGAHDALQRDQLRGAVARAQDERAPLAAVKA